MRYTTTNSDQLVTENYPFGHRVNGVAGNVCWKLTDWQLWRASLLVRLHRVWVEIADVETPGANHPGCVASADSTGARRATGDQISRVSSSGRRSKPVSTPCDVRNTDVMNSLTKDAVNATSMRRRSANSAEISKRTSSATGLPDKIHDHRIWSSLNVMNIDRRNADTEKARSANSGPSRISMSVVVVGTRSDSRQTA